MAKDRTIAATAQRKTTLLGLLRRGRKDQSGATVVEFALVLPAFLAMLFSIFEVCLLFFRQNLLDNAVDAAARTVLTGDTLKALNSADSAGKAEIEDKFLKKICDESFFYAGSKCSEVKIQVLSGTPQINAGRAIDPAMFDTAANPVVINIPAGQGFQNLPSSASGSDQPQVMIRVFAPATVLLARLNGIGFKATSGTSILMSSTAFVVEPFQ
jgi:Flp pilus assembly protein TadG